MNFIEEKINEGDLNNLTFRFPPEPNGYLHLGHAKAICLNFGLAESYNTKCNLRFDDTNPVNDYVKYESSIIDDIKWLGYNWEGEPKRASNYFSYIHESAIKLINKGLAYVDDSTSDEIANLKGTLERPGINSPYRNRTVSENLELFKAMERSEIKSVLRAKIDMASPNMILRDPVIYRIADGKLCPMYDFAHPLSDYIEGITHSLCTLEFEVHRPLYNWILENLDLSGRLPEQIEFARLNVEYMVMSKRYLKELVDNNTVTGWDDPRMPTISGLRRRGFTAAAIKDFCNRVGYTKKDSIISSKLLDECLRNDLNKNAFRLMTVLNAVRLTIRNWDKGTEYLTIENNPEDESAGTREVSFSGNLWIDRDDFREVANNKFHRLKLDGEVRLKGAYIIKAVDVVKDAIGNIIEIICDYDPNTKSGMPVDRKVKGTIHWVDRDNCLPVTIREYDKLFLDVEATEINPNSIELKRGYTEVASKNCEVEKPVQFMRMGYYTFDRDTTSNNIIFNKTVSLKDSFTE
jgi:glutaminyl-tRNA synthetase